MAKKNWPGTFYLQDLSEIADELVKMGNITR